MNLKKYQDWTLSVAVYPGSGTRTFPEVLYLTLGLSSEAGEVAGKIKKIVRGERIDPESYVSELSDVLWYLARSCDAAGITLEDLADYNVAKLESRKQEGTIQGEDTKDGNRVITSNA